MFGLEDIRKTRIWQEAKEEGKQEGMKEGKQKAKQETSEEVVGVIVFEGKTIQEVSGLLDIPEEEVRRLAKTLAEK